MDYFKNLQNLLSIEREEDKQAYQKLTQSSTIAERRGAGMAWYPIAIRGTEISRGDYICVEVERTTHQDVNHQLPGLLFTRLAQGNAVEHIGIIFLHITVHKMILHDFQVLQIKQCRDIWRQKLVQERCGYFWIGETFLKKPVVWIINLAHCASIMAISFICHRM